MLIVGSVLDLRAVRTCVHPVNGCRCMFVWSGTVRRLPGGASAEGSQRSRILTRVPAWRTRDYAVP